MGVRWAHPWDCWMEIPESVHLLSFLLEQVKTKHVNSLWKENTHHRTAQKLIWTFSGINCKNMQVEVARNVPASSDHWLPRPPQWSSPIFFFEVCERSVFQIWPNICNKLRSSIKVQLHGVLEKMLQHKMDDWTRSLEQYTTLKGEHYYLTFQ